MLCGHEVENDSTLDLLAKTALSHVQAGADMVAPSDMMDGRVLAIRRMLDKNGHKEIPIMSYAVNTHLRSTDRSVKRQIPLRHSETERVIRWIRTTAGKV